MEATVTSSTVESSASAASRVATDRRIAGTLFFALAAEFLVVVALAAALVPGYDVTAAAISDLGVVPQTALLFNGSLVFVGLATVAGGYFLYRWHGTRWVFALYALAGLGAIVAGVFTLASAPGIHGIGALLAFLFFNLMAIGTATRLVGPLRVLSVLLGLLGLAFVAIMAVGDAGNAAVFGPIGHGGTERMIVYPPMLWLLAVGGHLMGTRPDRIDGSAHREPDPAR